MKILPIEWKRGGLYLPLAVIGLFLNGCGSLPVQEPAFSEPPPPPAGTAVGTTPSAPVATNAPSATAPSSSLVGRFRVGDLVTVAFSGIEPPPPPHEERIKEDGTITLPLIGSVLAKGKTAGELQKEIQDRYVPRYYLRLTATVKPLELAYYVGGEVKSPGSRPWFAQVRLTQAIQAAGDFTDFANKRKVQLIRADGTRLVINWKDAINNPERDPEILPGDTITVPRSIW